VKDHYHVRFERKGSLVTASQRVGKNVSHAAFTFARPIVVGVLFGGIPGGILDMDMDNMVGMCSQNSQASCLGQGLGLTDPVENGIGGIENPLKPGAFVEELQAMLPAHASVVHAVFVHRLQAGHPETYW